MWSVPTVACSLVFFEFLCRFQCHPTDVSTVKLKILNPNDLDISDPGWNSNEGDGSIPLAQPLTSPLFNPYPDRELRVRREIEPSKHVNSKEWTMNWNNNFDIEPYTTYNADKYTDEYVKLWLEDAESLRNQLQNLKLDYSHPEGLLIVIPDDNITMTVLTFDIKLNERPDSDTISARNEKTGEGWVCFFPTVNVTLGDELSYDIRALFGRENFDVKIKGVIRIEGENPIVRGSSMETITFCPPISPTPQSHPFQGDRQPLKIRTLNWYHQFAINPTYNHIYTKKSADSWLNYANQIKKKLEADMYLLSTPRVITIVIPDNHEENCKGDAKGLKIHSLDIKLNEEFKRRESGHFRADLTKTIHGWRYTFHNSTVEDGDEVYYWMRVGYDHVCSTPDDNIVTGRIGFSDNNLKSEISNTDLTQFCPGQSEANQNDTVKPLRVTNHKLTINAVNQKSVLEDSQRWIEDSETLKSTLKEHMSFKLFLLKVMRMTLSAEGKKINVLAFHIKLNEGFQNVTLGPYKGNVRRRINRWIYTYPDLMVKEGDRIFYWMRVLYGEDKWDCVVRGEVEVTENDMGCYDQPTSCGGPGKPFLRVKGFHSKPASVQPPSLEADLGEGTVGGDLTWSHSLTINSVSEEEELQERFTKDSASKWLEDAELLKNTLKQALDFEFLNPSGFKFSVTGNDTYLEKGDVQIRLNGQRQFPQNQLQQAEMDEYIGVYPDMKVKMGDQIKYTINSRLSKHYVGGKLDITSR